MTLNATVEMEPLTCLGWPNIPFTPRIRDRHREMTPSGSDSWWHHGYDAVAAANAGAKENLPVLAIHAPRSRGDTGRDVWLIPSSAQGTTQRAL